LIFTSTGIYRRISAPGIGHLRSLTDLDFSNTPLSSLPAEIGNLTSAENFEIYGCLLTSLHCSCFQ